MPRPLTRPALLAAAALAAPAIAQNLPTEVVARRGDAGPAGIYISFANARLNQLGDLMFFSDTGAETILARRGLGSVETVARVGQASPVAGETFDFLDIEFEGAILGEDGSIAFAAALSANGDAFDGIFQNLPSGGNLTIATFGSPFPMGLYEGRRGSRLTYASNSNNGNFGFMISLQDSATIDRPNNEALVGEIDGQRVVFAQEGEPLPGGSELVDSFDSAAFYPAVNATGDAVFNVDLDTNSNETAIYHRSPNGVTTRIAREGDAAPGGDTFENINEPYVLPSGDALFTADLTGFNNSLFRWNGSAITPVVRQGDTFDGLALRAIQNTPQRGGGVNDFGEAAFNAFLSPGGSINSNNDGALIAQINGENLLLAREGQDAPGFSGPDFFGASSVQINNLGDVAWITNLQTGENGVTFGNDAALTVRDRLTGVSTVVLREGDQIDVGFSAPLLRTVSGINLDAGFDFDTAGGLSDSGKIAYVVSFTDGTSALLISEFRDGNPADQNADGNRDVFDFIEYLRLFDAGDPAADLNGDGGIDQADVMLEQTLIK